MEDWSDKPPMQQIIDVLAFVQGTQIADAALLHALIISHPDPVKLLDAWRRVVAPKLARAATQSIAGEPTTTSDREYAERLQGWTERVEAQAARVPPKA